jgi:hypothetical protein
MGEMQPTCLAKLKHSNRDTACLGDLCSHLADSEQFSKALIGDSGSSLQQWADLPFLL